MGGAGGGPTHARHWANLDWPRQGRVGARRCMLYLVCVEQCWAINTQRALCGKGCVRSGPDVILHMCCCIHFM